MLLASGGCGCIILVGYSNGDGGRSWGDSSNVGNIGDGAGGGAGVGRGIAVGCCFGEICNCFVGIALNDFVDFGRSFFGINEPLLLLFVLMQQSTFFKYGIYKYISYNE